MKYGYARVSTLDQDAQLQVDALKRDGVEQIFEEKRSGSDARRPVLEKVIKLLRPGDVLVVYKLDRLARSLKHLLQILERLTIREAQFRSLTETIDTTTPAGRMMMQIVGAFAEFELEMIRDRTRAGLRAAKDRGVKLGRPRALVPEAELEVVRRFTEGKVSRNALAREYGVHISSIKRALRRVGAIAPAKTRKQNCGDKP
jgi:DNA invertase Pin-like site-specific DNA recombinase